MRLTRSQFSVLLLAILTVAVGAVTNVATGQMPPWIQPYLWLSWPILGVLAVLFVALSLYQARQEPPLPEPPTRKRTSEEDIHYHAPPPPVAPSLHQLPRPPADFTGREAELTQLITAIEGGGATISGVRGMGGVGKTVLALKLAEQLTPRYPDAQFYLDLRGTDPQPLSSADAMAHVIRAYHPTARLPESEAELSGLYRSVLHDQRALLLMDNAAGREQVAPLIPPAGSVMLVTSRRHFTLPGLQAVNLDTLPPADARALLLKIAARIGDCADDMAALCGCLPLALRLAGSVLAERVDLSPVSYLERLTDAQTRLGLVDASLSLSYELLSEEMQQLWCRLAVFPGTFDSTAAAAVWEMEPDAAQDGLSELVRYSLVEWNPDAARYGLHDLARLSAPDRAVAQGRHATHYETVLRAADALYKQGDESIEAGLALFDLEWPNVQTGQAWAARHAHEDEEAAHLCNDYPDAGLYCLNLRQHPHEWIRWTEAALDAARCLKHREAEGAHLGNLGLAYRALGQVEWAIEYHEAALEIAQEIGDRRSEGAHLGNLGNAYFSLGQVERAIQYHEAALEIAQEIGDRRGEGADLGSLGLAYRALGQVEADGDRPGAIEYYEAALEIAQEIGDRRGEGIHVGNLGNAYSDLGQVERAIAYYEAALEIAQEIGDRRGEGIHVGSLGNAYSALGQVERAIEYYEAALEIAQETGDRRGEGTHLGNLGNAHSDLGQVERAIEYHEAALEIAQEIGDRRNEGIHCWNLGLLYEDTDPVRAVELMEVYVAYQREIGHPDAEAHAQRVAQIRARLDE